MMVKKRLPSISGKMQSDRLNRSFERYAPKPKAGCDCISYNGQVLGQAGTPEVVRDYAKYFPDAGRKTVSLDACIADAIERLWAAGVRTGACCCGHNGTVPIANGRPNVMLINAADAAKAYDVLASEPREWWITLWAGRSSESNEQSDES